MVSKGNNLEKQLGEITNNMGDTSRRQDCWPERAMWRPWNCPQPGEKTNRPKKDWGKKARLVWKQILGSKGCWTGGQKAKDWSVRACVSSRVFGMVSQAHRARP